MLRGEVIFYLTGEEREPCDVVNGDPHSLQSERDPADTASSGIGVLLREAREDLGESLRGVSRTLRIRRIYLEAIEDGRFQDLPGPAYATGFIRTYADHLGLDCDEIIRRFHEEAKDFGGKVELDFPVPVPESGIPGRAVLMVGLIVAAGAYGAWYFNASRESATADLIPPPPDHLVAEVVQATQAAQASNQKAPAAVPEAQASAAVAASPAPPSAQITAAPAPGNTQTVIEATADPADSSGPAEVESSPSVAAAPGFPREPGPAYDGALATSEPEGQVVTPPEARRIAAAAGTPPAPSESVAEITETPSASMEPATGVAETPPASNPRPAPPASSPRPAPAVETEAPPVEAGNEDAVQVAVLPPLPDMPAAEPHRARTYGADNAESRILLRARVNSWIQVRDEVNNRLLVTRLLRVGDSFRVPDRPGLKLLTGNAGGLDILVDGEVVPPIGPLGAVRRDVALDTASLRQGAAARN